MSRRFLALVAAVVLVAAACGAGPDEAAGGADRSLRPLAYSLTGGLDLSYRVDMDVEITTSFGEEFGALNPGSPESMNLAMAMGFDSHYRIEEAADPGTYKVTLEMENLSLDSGSIDMGVDSRSFEDIPQSEIDGLLASQLPELSFLVDERGEVSSIEIAGKTIDVNGLLGGTSAVGGVVGQMFGPEFPEGDVAIGDSWTTTSEQALPGMAPIVTEETHTITGSENRGGRDAWIIKTEATTAAYTITWDDLLAMAESLGGMAEIGVDESIPPAFQLSMRMAPTGATLITWFDPELGLTVGQDVSTAFAMTVEMAGIPGAGGPASMSVDGSMHMATDLLN